ncbi:MAG: c-type cytochrome [Ahrensia sp.]|nr:c-type cytochrome [Ahrensia sp.]
MILFPRFSAHTFAALLVLAFADTARADGDKEYGEYLSSECVTCHQIGATAGQIPSIAGMDAQGFADIMKAYRGQVLENPAMQTVAKRLTDEDIAALAAYFSSLPEPQ